MEPGSLVMERKMLRGIKQRAERMAATAAAGAAPAPMTNHGSPASPADHRAPV